MLEVDSDPCKQGNGVWVAARTLAETSGRVRDRELRHRPRAVRHGPVTADRGDDEARVLPTTIDWRPWRTSPSVCSAWLDPSSSAARAAGFRLSSLDAVERAGISGPGSQVGAVAHPAHPRGEGTSGRSQALAGRSGGGGGRPADRFRCPSSAMRRALPMSNPAPASTANSNRASAATTRFRHRRR